MDSAEPSLKEFMAHPQMQYLKQNPKAIAAICAILCAVSIRVRRPSPRWSA